MSKPTRRPSSSFLAGVTAVTLMFGAVAPARAAAPPGKASVLTLEGDDPARATALSKALQSEFAARGVGGGREMSLAELKLTMGCDEPPSVACLSSGGKTLGVDRMVYGTLTKTKSGGYSLTLSMMEIGSATVQRTVNTELSAGALADGAIQATAKDMVVQIMGPEAAAEVKPQPDETTPTEVGPKDDGQRKWIWGRYNAPTWKKAGLAASAALTVVSLGVAIGTYVMIKPNGKLYNDLIDAANNSQTDENDDNNIDPHTRDDLCTLARAQSGGEVKNAEMTKICNKADGLASASTAAFIATGVFAASTLVFTTLLFVHKNKPGVARLRHHGVTMGMAPTRGGGVMLGGSLRF